jgi:hypothetical protein
MGNTVPITDAVFFQTLGTLPDKSAKERTDACQHSIAKLSRVII